MVSDDSYHLFTRIIVLFDEAGSFEVPSAKPIVTPSQKYHTTLCPL